MEMPSENVSKKDIMEAARSTQGQLPQNELNGIHVIAHRALTTTSLQ
jgi:hypothetical protein